MARPTMPGGVSAGDYITETWGDRTNTVLDWIGQDHVSWSPVLQVSSGAPFDSTTSYARVVKIGSLFIAVASIAVDKAISSQTIYCTTPFTQVNAEAVWGGFRYNLSGTAVYTGYAGINSTTRVGFQRDNQTTEMTIATTVDTSRRISLSAMIPPF